MNDPKSLVSDPLVKEGGSAMGVSPRMLPFLLPPVLAATLASALLPIPRRRLVRTGVSAACPAGNGRDA